MTISTSTSRRQILTAEPADGAEVFLRDLLDGLALTPRCLSPKYFYDAAGSALFDRICELPEYYPTRTEIAILTERAGEIVEQIGPWSDFVEFGAGSLTKVRLLLDAFSPLQAPQRYLPIDISGEHLGNASRRLRERYPQLAVEPIVADYLQPLALPGGSSGARRVGFFPGSTIGNFHPHEALAFLRSTARLLRGGGLLIGVDLVKDPAVLHAAYNDAQGITAEFNRNVLRRANAELGADFDVDAFMHYAPFNPLLRRVEMHLVSGRKQTVHVDGQRIEFGEGDSIHTESSYKYTIDGFRRLAVQAGYRPKAVWTDDAGLFSVHWLVAPAG